MPRRRPSAAPRPGVQLPHRVVRRTAARPNVGARAAPSSIASGSPSRRRQVSAMTATSSSVEGVRLEAGGTLDEQPDGGVARSAPAGRGSGARTCTCSLGDGESLTAGDQQSAAPGPPRPAVRRPGASLVEDRLRVVQAQDAAVGAQGHAQTVGAVRPRGVVPPPSSPRARRPAAPGSTAERSDHQTFATPAASSWAASSAEPGLADAAWTDQRHEPLLAQALEQQGAGPPARPSSRPVATAAVPAGSGAASAVE